VRATQRTNASARATRSHGYAPAPACADPRRACSPTHSQWQRLPPGAAEDRAAAVLSFLWSACASRGCCRTFDARALATTRL
jgi:hypothetical protein